MTMNKLKNSKAFRIVISILVALVIWLYVEEIDPSITTTTIRRVPVEFTRESVLTDRGLMVSGEEDLTIDLTLEGQRNVITDLGSGRDVRVQVDLSTITTVGQYSLTYQVVYPDSVNGSSIDVVDASAYRVSVNVVELYQKSITVRGERVGTPAEGYMAGEMTFGTDTILLSGEQLAVSNISHALVTVDVTGADETIRATTGYQLIDFNGEVVDPDSFRVSAETVEVTVPILMIKELPLVVDYISANGSREEDIAQSITPPTITVAGDSNSISRLEEIVIAEVNLSELTRDTSFSVPIPIPAGATNLSGDTEAVVTISFMGLETRTFTAGNISFINEPEDLDGREITVVTNAVDVILRGPAEALDRVQDYNIRVVGDMTDITAASGNYAIPAAVYVDGSDEVGAIGTYQITVHIGR